MSKTKNKEGSIGILGAGAFGTALALAYHDKFDVTLFSCFDDHVNSMRQTRVNEFFKDVKIPEDIEIGTTANFNPENFNYLFWVFPIRPTPEILKTLKGRIDKANVIVCSKGLLPDLTFICDLFQRELPLSNVGYLAGPNFAIELATGKISAADVASKNIELAKTFAQSLSTDQFRLNAIDDMVGSQIAGAIKNLVAIASGIAYGLEFGENTHAALITESLSEMKSLGLKLGAKESTFYGLCGLGDLILTASSMKSRNTTLGMEIAQGKPIDELLKVTTCEGYDTIHQIIEISRNNGIKMPICEAVYRIIFEHHPPITIADVFK